MIEKRLTDLTVTLSEGRDGLQVHVRRRLCESTIAGGRIVHENERYEGLTRDEAFDVVASIMDGPHPGELMPEPMTLFALQ